MKPLYLVAGARPNFIKLAPLARALQTLGGLPFQIVHTGQHYDEAMSEAFFRVLDIPAPDHALQVGPAPINLQTARILERFDALLTSQPPSGVVVFGDVTSTLACALAAKRHQLPVAHVEAGLRSFDNSMPEELNRRLTDALADLLLVSEPSGVENLRHEGAAEDKIHLVGNIMIDTLIQQLPQARLREAHTRLGLPEGGYALLTLHRPSNVDDPATLRRLLAVFTELSAELPIVFPVHPRTQKMLNAAGGAGSLYTIPPVDYLDALCLQAHARLVLTDSGGMQEETSYLDVPCLTLRENTERPITLEQGTSTLVGNDPQRIRSAFRQVMDGGYKHVTPYPLWDGQCAFRIAALLPDFF